MPMLGLGVWQVPNGAECVNAVRWAFDAGYRHIDTAQAYGNEESVGKALRDSGVPRDEVFITTKFYPGHKDPGGVFSRGAGQTGKSRILTPIASAMRDKSPGSLVTTGAWWRTAGPRPALRRSTRGPFSLGAASVSWG